jgi:hypothetical protein
MSRLDCQQVQKLLERAYVEANAEMLRQARQHVRGCQRCAAVYDRLFAADRALAESDATLSLTARELLKAEVLPAVAQKPSWGRRRRTLMVTAVATLAAVIIVAIALSQLMVSFEPAKTESAFMARGSSRPGRADASDADPAKRAAALAPVGLRAICLQKQAKGFKARSLGTKPDPAVAPCRQQDLLAFTVRNETRADWQLQLIAVPLVGRSGTDPTALRPRLIALRLGADNKETAVVTPTKDERPLDTRLQLTSIPPGKLAVYALFSRQPLSSGRLRGLLRRTASLSATETLIRLVIEVQ